MFHLICTFLLISLQLQTSVHGAQASGLSSNTTIESNITDSQLNTYLISSHGLSDVQDKELESTYAESKESKKIRKKKKCNNCKKEHNNLQVCKGCCKIRYCNKHCQKRDWKAHRDLCRKPIKQYRELKIKWNKAHKSDPIMRLTRTSAKMALRAGDGDLAEAEKYVQKIMKMFSYIKYRNPAGAPTLDARPSTLDEAISLWDASKDLWWETNKVDVTETEEKDADSNTALESDRLKLKIQKKIAEKKEERCGKKYQNRRTKKRGKKRKSHRK
eukprot:50811_1